MKKVINGSSNDNLSYLEGGYTEGYDRLHPYFNEVGNYAYNRGYELTGVGVNPVFTCKENDKFMPKLSVRVQEEDGVYYFWPFVEMPKIDGEQLNYYDSFKYYADKYKDVAEICTYLMKYPLDSSKWANSKAEEAEYED